MKKQIVITLNKTESGWTGEIYGKVNDKKTDKIKNIIAGYTQVILTNIKDECDKIEKWMEQIR